MHGEGILDNGSNYRYQGLFFDGYFNGYGELFESEIIKFPSKSKVIFNLFNYFRAK